MACKKVCVHKSCSDLRNRTKKTWRCSFCHQKECPKAEIPLHSMHYCCRFCWISVCLVTLHVVQSFLNLQDVYLYIFFAVARSQHRETVSWQDVITLDFAGVYLGSMVFQLHITTFSCTCCCNGVATCRRFLNWNPTKKPGFLLYNTFCQNTLAKGTSHDLEAKKR